jgi:glucokinase
MRIGFDLGGTKMLAAVLDGKNTILGKSKARTGTGDNETMITQIVSVIREAIEDAGNPTITALGIAVPGPIDISRGMILEPPNLSLRNAPVAAMLEKELKFPVILENDVNAGLWGEYVAGCAKGKTHVIGLFPGTGIGGGIIVNGALYRGKMGSAGEVGHMIIQRDGPLCGCGNFGCLEAVASKTAIARNLAVLAQNGRSPVLVDAGATDIRQVKSGLIAKALKAGDPGVAQVIDQAATFLGIGMANLVNIFDPELIVLGGGLVEKLGDSYVKTAEAAMRNLAMAGIVQAVEVRQAKLSDYAAVIGAADLARHAEA